MYQFEKVKKLSYSPELFEHQAYFVLRWGELLESSAMHFRKLLRPCSRAVLKEALQVFLFYKKNILKEYNIKEMVEEIIATLQSDSILKLFFPRDRELVFNVCNSIDFSADSSNKTREIERLTVIIKTLSNKLENQDIPELYSLFLKKQLENNYLSFEQLDHYLSLLISDLLYEGHSKEYLYNWGKGVFLKDEEPNFMNKIERIARLGRKNKREFQCYLKVNIPEEFSHLNILTSENMQLLQEKDLSPIIDQLKEDAVDFLHDEKKLYNVRMNIDAVDEYSAEKKARSKLYSVTKLFTLENKYRLFNPGIANKAIVNDIKGKQVYYNLLRHKDAHRNKIQGLHISNLDYYIKVYLSKSEFRFQGIDHLLQWCRVIQESPNEIGLVAIWSLFEYLFVSDHTNKRKGITEKSVAYIAHFFIKNIAWRSRLLCKLDNSAHEHLVNEIRKDLGEQCIDKTKNEVKLHFFYYYIKHHCSKLENFFQQNTMAKRYIYLLEKYIQKRGSKIWLLDYLDELEEQIKRDLFRAYRLRNILAHQAYISEELFTESEIYETILFYLKIILEDLLYSMTLQPDHTIHEQVQIKLESYKEYKRMFKREFSFDNVNAFRDLLYVQSLLL